MSFYAAPIKFAKASGKTTINTSLNAMDATRTSDHKVQIMSVKLHLDGTCTTSETFQLREDAGDGTSYDVLAHSQDMSGIANDIWLPIKPYVLDKSTDLDGSFQNTDANDWGIEIAYQEIL